MSSLVGRDRAHPRAAPSRAPLASPAPAARRGTARTAGAPAGLRELLDDRLCLLRLLAEGGIPHLPALAVLAPGGSGWSWEAGRAVGPRGWALALDALHGGIVLTSTRRADGCPPRRWLRGPGGWRGPDGRTRGVQEVADHLRRIAPHRTWLVQRAPEPYTPLTGAGDGPHLRLRTRLQPSGALRVEAAALVGGPRGDEVVALDPATGATVPGAPGAGAGRVAAPRVPLWDEALALAIRASEALVPLGGAWLGLALEPGGPVVQDVWADDPPAPAPAPATPRRRRRLAEVGALRRAAREVYGVPALPVIARAARLRRTRGLPLRESLERGLLEPGHRAHPDVVPHAERIRLQARLNAAGAHALADDRALLALLAQAAGLPAPPLRALLARDDRGWTSAGDRGVAAGEWGAALDALPGDLTVRPHGGPRGALAALRTGGTWRPGGDAAGAAARLAADDRVGLWVVQEALATHPALARIGPAGARPSLQVITLVAADGRVELVRAWLAVRGPVPGAELVAEASTAEGRLGPARVPGRGGYGLRAPAPMAETAAALEGTALPRWEEVRVLAARAATALLPLRTLALTLALTPAGPLLLEADPFWDLPGGEDLRPVLARLGDA